MGNCNFKDKSKNADGKDGINKFNKIRQNIQKSFQYSIRNRKRSKINFILNYY